MHFTEAAPGELFLYFDMQHSYISCPKTKPKVEVSCTIVVTETAPGELFFTDMQHSVFLLRLVDLEAVFLQ